MTESTITCPNCHTVICLTESLAAPLIAATRQQFEQQLCEKDEDVAKREQAVREKEKLVTDAKLTLDDQVADQVATQLKTERLRGLRSCPLITPKDARSSLQMLAIARAMAALCAWTGRLSSALLGHAGKTLRL